MGKMPMPLWATPMTISPASRHPWFRWYVCGLLLLATTVNYMDRLHSLRAAAPQIKTDFHLSNEQYGELETWFGLAYAVGSLAFGLLSDQMSVRNLNPAVLLAWSFLGIATAWMQTFAGLLACRTLLGWFESAHWSCALKTTQRLLSPGERTLGNSVLQLGASVGAVLTPLVLAVALRITQKPGTWRDRVSGHRGDGNYLGSALVHCQANQQYA